MRPEHDTHRAAGTEADAGPLVLVVEDDQGVREGLCDLLASAGVEARGFGCTTELLAADLPDRPGCLVLDVHLPGSSGLDLQHQLAMAGSRMPVIFITGHGDIPTSVRAMKAGAQDFLTKPFSDHDMLHAVRASIREDQARRDAASALLDVSSLAATLTAREAAIMAAVAQGLLNKQIAYRMGLSEITVKIHRGRLMRKMQAGSVAELVRKWELLRRAEADPAHRISQAQASGLQILV